jgi:hypothetical protein
MQRLVYDLTSDVILGEDIEMRSWGIWLREAHRVVGQKLHRQLVSAIQAGAMKDGREQRIEKYDCGRYESISAWVTGVKTADFCDEIFWISNS